MPIGLFRYADGTKLRLGLVAEGRTMAPPQHAGLDSVTEWLSLPDPVSACRAAAEAATPLPFTLDDLEREARLLAPLDRQEVWAAGVTYLRSKEARMEESEGGGSFYDRVYQADRPELFLKATPSRLVGPGREVRIRSDSEWNVPEPELALVISPAGRLVGYTIGNDMSSRDIEGANPLYLPQAKVYKESCALGPLILLEEEQRPHREFALRLTIRRGDQAVFSGETSTGRMKRQFQELIEYLWRDNLFMEGAFLLTGTGIVPPDDFTLQVGDQVEIACPEIGVLRNHVVQS